MSLKSIELQLTVPKTQELGKVQNNYNQRSIVNQNAFQVQMKQEEIKNKKRTEEIKKSALEEQNTARSPKLKDNLKGRYIDIEL